MSDHLTNIVVAGLGGQGVLKASDILSDTLMGVGFDVKKSEVHGMSQRGGSVCSDVRFGPQVFSPMVPPGEAHFLVVLEPTQVDPNRHLLRPDGVLLTPDAIDAAQLPNKKSLNVALMGALSAHLPQVPEQLWLDALKNNFPENLFEANRQAFQIGRTNQKTT